MTKVKVVNINEIGAKHKNEVTNYEYYKKNVVKKDEANQCVVSVYEIPPLKSGYPYHYHLMNEEVFYIISGNGLLKTSEGEREVKSGDFLFFPACEEGAHILTNQSKTEKLVYIDFDTKNEIDVSFYPITKKIGVWGKNTNKVFSLDDEKKYYDDEE